MYTIYVLQKLSSTTDASKEQYGLNVALLDVSKLLENLVRQYEPLLDHLDEPLLDHLGKERCVSTNSYQAKL